MSWVDIGRRGIHWFIIRYTWNATFIFSELVRKKFWSASGWRILAHTRHKQISPLAYTAIYTQQRSRQPGTERALCDWWPSLVTAVTVIKPVVQTSQSDSARHMIARVRMMREILWFVVVCSVWRVSEPANGTVGECWRRRQRITSRSFPSLERADLNLRPFPSITHRDSRYWMSC